MKSATKDYIYKIAEYFKGQPIIRAWLFGSYSRGDETIDSDIDILVDYDKSSKLSLLTICGMMTDLKDILDKRTQIQQYIAEMKNRLSYFISPKSFSKL